MDIKHPYILRLSIDHYNCTHIILAFSYAFLNCDLELVLFLFDFFIIILMANILFAVYKKTWKSDRWNLNYFMSVGSGQGCHFWPSFLSFYNCFIMYLSDFYSSNMPYSGTQWQIPFYWTGVFSSFVNFSCVWRWPAEDLGPLVWSQQPFFWHSFSEKSKKKPINV